MFKAYKGVLLMRMETSVALGFFDGVHKAHENIILSAVKEAQRLSLEPIVLTFDKSPQEILSPNGACYIITTDEKKKICESLGARLCLLKMDEKLLGQSPEDFVKHILQEYGVRHVSCGYNYRFGKNAQGDADLLKKLGKEYGFSVTVTPCITENGGEVSSSRIRRLIKEGNIKEANELLGRRFSVTGEVCHGKQLGKTIGFPTANVFLDKGIVVPKKGVYETRTIIEGSEYISITNAGINPTVGEEALKLETYICGFSENLYGRKIRVEFVRFIRSETKFGSIEALKKQISEDIQQIIE